ncbi:MAG: SpoIIE family protein phosphatase [Janthinobacterium lividum]
MDPAVVDATAVPDQSRGLRPESRLDVSALTLLQRFSFELASALDVRAAVTAVLRTGRDVLRTSSCGVALLDPTGALLLPQEPDEPAPEGLGRGLPVPVASATPSAEVARTRSPVLLRTRAELATRYGTEAGRGGLNASVLAHGEQSWAMLPLLARGRLLGVLRFGFRREGSLDELEESVAVTLAGQCAFAVERAQLLTTAREAVVAAARSEQRYRTLAEAGRLDVFTAEPGVGLTGDLPGWRALTGRAGAVTGLGWSGDVHPEDVEQVLATWRSSVRAGNRGEFRVRLRTPGGWRRLSAVAVPVHADPEDLTSPVLEWVGSIDDVTERVLLDRRSRSLQTLTTALASASSYPEVLDAVLRASLEGPGAVRGTLALVEGHGEGAGVTLHRLLLSGSRQSEDLHTVTVADHLAEMSRLAGSDGSFFGPDDIAVLSGPIRPYFEEALAAGEQAWVVLPLTSPRRRLGTLTLGFRDVPLHGESEREFLLTFARQVAGALERMQLLQVQRDTATVLQEALQPGPLPQVGWLTSHRVAATSAGVEVGGDWAELITLGADQVAVVLGDVMGRGARAATVMGEVRAQVRTLALIDPHPSAVLRGLDACARAGGAEDLVTIFYGLLSRDGRLLAGSAGHLPPLSCNGGAQYLDVPPGLPIGVGPGDGGIDQRAEVLEVRLVPGSGLVVFSDGLVETRTRSLTEGLEHALERFRATAGGTPAQIVDALMTELVDQDEVDDDVTVLALRLQAGPER